MICFDPSTGVTLWHISCYFSLYSCPPEIFLQILVHLIGSQMNGIPWAVGLVHDLKTKLEVLRNHKTVLKPQNPIDILSEALRFSWLYSLAEMTHSNIRPMSGNDVFFDGWNESYIVQSALRNNPETWFFGITTWRVRLDRDMIASVFVAQGIGNHICLARMIMDFQLIILHQF
jgi:hypothetical protein